MKSRVQASDLEKIFLLNYLIAEYIENSTTSIPFLPE
jgi:hypothetical protein